MAVLNRAVGIPVLESAITLMRTHGRWRCTGLAPRQLELVYSLGQPEVVREGKKVERVPERDDPLDDRCHFHEF